MATLKQVFDLATDPPVQERIIAAMRHQAIYILTAEVTPAADRVALAKAVLRDATTHRPAFQVQIADNPTAQTSAYSGGTLNSSNIVDGDVEYIVGVTWDSVADLYFNAEGQAV